MKSIKIYCLIVSLVFSNTVFAQTGFVNNGLVINVEQGAFLNVQDFTNTQTGGINGTIDIDGTVIINGNINNVSTGNVFTNIEVFPDGDIILGGTNQSIQGTTPVFFENLNIKNATKTLNLSDCEVEGVLTVQGVLDLNHNLIRINNGAPGAINYLSGYIKSETLPGSLGELEWKIGDATGTYSVPFGSGLSASADLNLIFKTLSAASPAEGSVVFATYPTSGALNIPLPAGIGSLDTFKAENLSDRYWEIKPLYNVKPDISLGLKYTAEDVDQTDNPQLVELNLKAIRYNDDLGKWNDIKMMGTCDAANKIVNVDNIANYNFYTWWTLSEFELKIPNAFTPDGDGKNDIFLKGNKVEIVNRWGQKLFEGSDGWDGTVDGSLVSPGTYYYIATLPEYGGDKTYTGVIMVVKK
jgi:gliding motility-associated-like protein